MQAKEPATRQHVGVENDGTRKPGEGAAKRRSPGRDYPRREGEMSVDAVQEPRTRLRVEIVNDGTRTPSREDVAAEDGPRPVDDEKLEAVAGGGSYRVEFHDGCTINVIGVDSHEEAAFEARDIHRTAMGHTTTDCTVYIN